MYWRFEEDVMHVELDYPRDISIWSGVPYAVDAAFRYTDGKTYFFKGKNFWEFHDRRMAVLEPEPTPIAETWMHCPKEIQDPFKSGVNVSSGIESCCSSLILMTVAFLLVVGKLS